MANTLTAVTPKLLAQGLMALRENSIMPRLVNGDYDTMAAQKGATIDVPIPSAVTAAAVTAAITPPANADSAPTSVAIALSQWYEAPFYLTDKDMMTAMDGVIPMQASEAIKALGNNVDNYLFALYTGCYGYAGVAGTAPFVTDTSEATDTRKILNKQLAPMGDRRFVIDPDAEANALNLRAFQDTNFAVTGLDIADGNMPRKLGFNWWMDQNVPTHTVGTLTGTTGNEQALIDQADVAVGDETVALDDVSLTGTIVKGDIFTVAGDTQTYVCKATVTAAANAIAALTFSPPAKVAWADDAELTLKSTHTVNLAFHRDAIGFATRPLESAADGLGNIIQTATDPISGLSLRLEISRQHKQTRFSYDILYGATLVRPELMARCAG